MRPVRRSVRWQAAALGNLLRGGSRRIANLGPGQIDQYAEIDARVALQSYERTERHLRIGFRVDCDDQLAAPAQQLVDAQIIDVPAVGEENSR